MSVSAVGAVGTGGASAASGAGAVKNTGASGASAAKGAPASDKSVPAYPSSYGKSGGMSTESFISLSQQTKGIDAGIKDTKDMVKMAMALKLLEKVIEACSEILDNFVQSNK